MKGDHRHMNIIPYNYHTHTELCDGTASLEEMTLAAMKEGFKVIGFSGHCYTAYDDCYCMSLEEIGRAHV